MRKAILSALACLSLVLIGCEGKSSDGNKQNGVTLPPDPGEEGKKTLEGIDSDNDGVRDDIEIAIYEFAPERAEQRAALTQTAKGFQASVLAGDKNDTQAALEAWEALSKGLECLSQKYSDDENMAASIFLETTISNTDERLFAYWRFNELLSGKVFGGEDNPNPCDQ